MTEDFYDPVSELPAEAEVNFEYCQKETLKGYENRRKWEEAVARNNDGFVPNLRINQVTRNETLIGEDDPKNRTGEPYDCLSLCGGKTGKDCKGIKERNEYYKKYGAQPLNVKYPGQVPEKPSQ